VAWEGLYFTLLTSRQFSGMHGLNCAEFLEDIGPSLAFREFVLNCRYLAPFQKRAAQRQVVSKLRPNFAIFAPAIKIRRGVGNMSP